MVVVLEIPLCTSIPVEKERGVLIALKKKLPLPSEKATSGLCPIFTLKMESQGQNLASTVLLCPKSLDCGSTHLFIRPEHIQDEALNAWGGETCITKIPRRSTL